VKLAHWTLLFLVLVPVTAADVEPATTGARRVVRTDTEDKDGDGRMGEETAILERIRAYRERHGDDGTLTAAHMLQRSQWGYRKWLDEAQHRRQKGIEGEGWVSLGPINGAGRCTAVVPHPTIDGTLLGGAAGGGVWRTTNAGASWVPLTDGISDLSVGALAYAPSNPDVLYLGSGEGGLAGDFIPGIGLLRSDDGGETWFLPTGPGEIVASQFFALSVHPSDPDSVLAATNQGLLASSDGGVTWEVRIPAAGLLGVTEVVRSTSNQDRLYAAAWCEQACPAGIGRVMRSDDGGVTWEAVVSGLPTPSALSLGFNRAALAVAPSDDAILYVGLNTGDFVDGDPEARIYRSDDSGDSWTETADPTPYLGFQGWYDNTITVRPDDPTVVVAGGVYYVVSSDAGASWMTRNPYAGGNGLGTGTIPHVDGHDLQWQGSTLWLACDGGIWMSEDDGITWTGRNSGLVTRQYYGMAIDPMHRERVLGGTQDNATNLRNDAGDDTWEVVIGGDGFECAINPLLPDVMYGTVQFGLVFRNTTSGAGTWSNVSPLSGDKAHFITPLTMRTEAPWVLYTGTTRVWRTTDAGESWSALPTEVINGGWDDATVRAIAITPADPTVLMVAKARKIYRSDDGGSSWRLSIMERSVNNVEISPFEPEITLASMARVGSEDRQLMRSSDAGATWQPSGSGLPPFAVQVARWDPTDPSVVYVGTDVGLYRSTDGGISWTTFGDGLPAASIHDLRILPDGSMLRVATHGRGMWELNIPTRKNRDPTIRITSPPGPINATVGDRLELVAEASDPDGDQLSVVWFLTDDWTQRPGGSSAGTHESSTVIDLERPGTHILAAHVSDGRGGTAVATESVSVADPADDCSTPWVVPADGPFPLTIISSTAVGIIGSNDPTPPCVDEPEDPDAGRHGSIWFEFTPAESNRYTVSTCGSRPDTVLSVWTGDDCGPYLPVAGGCNDDDDNDHCVGPRTDSYLELDLEAGSTYRFMVGAWGSQFVGRFQLNVECSECEAVAEDRTYLVAAAANTTGLNDTLWVTDLTIFNPAAAPTTVSPRNRKSWFCRSLRSSTRTWSRACSTTAEPVRFGSPRPANC
jgi:photosystem II stability/assembly factor-like uncharacterized protein